ncbi:MAG: phenylacetate--CoA ligase, partial [bacterium]|nr:phenylacetate--CoA ligase [bacterium]
MTPHDLNPISKPDFMPVGELRALQLAKLQKLIPYEYERVPLFRRRCDEKGVKPRDLVTLRDLAKFPFMKKTDLRDEYPYGLTAAPLRDINRFHCSSGTTGKPICIPQTKGDLEVWTDATAR